MAERLETFNRTSDSDLVLKMGLHRGHAIAVSSNETLDYFGQTVNIAARIQALAGPGELCLSDAIYRAEGVSDVLSGMAMTRESRTMKGVDEPIPIYRVTLD
jgi:class 3 adenylate cyclase